MAVEFQIVRLNETFYPFNTLLTEFDMEHARVATEVIQEIPAIGQLYIFFSASDGPGISKLATLTPLQPEMGYPLDSEDLVSERRRPKLIRLKRKYRAKTIKGMVISAYAFIYDVDKENARFLCQHLFLVLTLPNGSSFASRGVCNENLEVIPFYLFFPTDIGLLPEVAIYDNKLKIGNEGFHLMLPRDSDLLKAITAKFVLLPDVNESDR